MYQPTFHTHLDLVRLDVLVVHDGRPVPGLTAADFEVRDDGVVRQIDHIRSRSRVRAGTTFGLP